MSNLNSLLINATYSQDMDISGRRSSCHKTHALSGPLSTPQLVPLPKTSPHPSNLGSEVTSSVKRPLVPAHAHAHAHFLYPFVC